MEYWQLKQRQSLPLDAKIAMSKSRIREWYDYWQGDVCVSFSGGKDSTVLLNLVRSMYPEVPAVFINTGLEYPEIVEFVKTVDNVTTLRPKKGFYKVIQEYGYPVISKVVAMGLDRHTNTKSDLQKLLRLHGGINPTSNKKQERSIPIKYHYLVNAPFKISERCCYFIKKEPFSRIKSKPFVGTMASDSRIRQGNYLKIGCNSFDSKKPKSQPLSFWTEQDIWEYIEKYDVPYSKIYDMGYDRTGCMFCMFGIIPESKKGLNRFQRMQKTHPREYKYCMETLGLKEVLEYIKVPYK